MVITGDLDQHDRVDEINGLADFLYKFRNNKSNAISSIEFGKEHVEREDVIKDVLSIYGETPCELEIFKEDEDEAVPNLISISPDVKESVLDQIMEANNEDSNTSDEDDQEYNNSSSYNSIPSSSFLNMGIHIFNKSNER